MEKENEEVPLHEEKNNMYRAHTCNYIGLSQTASQNRTKDTIINSEKNS